jgi:hypothetical protein
MRSFIKKLVREKLNEVALDCHFLSRSEDRIWGDGKSKGVPAATINTGAYEGSDVVDILDLKTCDDETKKEYIKHDIPITKFAQIILNKINKLESGVNFNTKYAIGIIFWKSKVIHKGGVGWGNTLVGIMRNNKMVTIQWQPAKDVNVSGGKVTDIQMILYVDDIFSYVTRTNNNTLTDNDLVAINQGLSKKTTPDVIKEPKINIDGVGYLVDTKTGDVRQKNGDKKILFKDLPSHKQEEVFDLI